jgi:hypothetical protein
LLNVEPSGTTGFGIWLNDPGARPTSAPLLVDVTVDRAGRIHKMPRSRLRRAWLVLLGHELYGR